MCLMTRDACPVSDSVLGQASQLQVAALEPCVPSLQSAEDIHGPTRWRLSRSTPRAATLQVLDVVQNIR